MRLVPVLLVALSFVAMEGVSYLTHRYVMHGVGMRWHRSHHAPANGGFEPNDLFPLCFSVLGFGLFLAATMVPALGPLFPVAIGVTLYGGCYLFVHDIAIHRRLHVRVPAVRYVTWLREAHARHHRFGGEPYGMLLPVLRHAVRGQPLGAMSGRLERSAPRRSARATRARL
jgi:beta-carotene 3-hydroxylase